MSSSTGTETGQKGDVVDFLLAQHRDVERLFEQIGQQSGDERKHNFNELVRLLAVHETAEEEVVYPVLRASGDDGDQLADARTAEEDEAKKALSDLERIGPESPEFDSKFEAFAQMVLSHATNEEQQVFPRLRETQTPDRLESMARAVEMAEKTAPTHPHPHGPESATGNMAVGPFVAVVDRVRDALRKFRDS